jgi:hypothetical protein
MISPKDAYPREIWQAAGFAIRIKLVLITSRTSKQSTAVKSNFHFASAMHAFRFLAAVIIILVKEADAAANATSKFGFYPGKSPIVRELECIPFPNQPRNNQQLTICPPHQL